MNKERYFKCIDDYYKHNPPLFIVGQTYLYDGTKFKGESDCYWTSDINNWFDINKGLYKFEEIYLNDEQKTNVIVEKINSDLEKALYQEKNNIEYEISRINTNIRNYKETLRDYFNQLQKHKFNIKNYTQDRIEETRQRVFEEIKNIMEHKLFKDINIKDGSLVVNTKDIVMTEPYTFKTYALGKMEINIPLDMNTDITIYNKSTTRTGYSDVMNHPHIWEDGSVCWGTADAPIAEFRALKELYALYITIINFCQTADIDDCAGWYLSMWDEIDKDGKIIEYGHCPDEDEYDGHGCQTREGAAEGEYYTCSDCGTRIDEDDAYYCDACGQYYCEDHASYYDELGYSLCHTCKDELYEECAECGQLERKEDMYNSQDGLICKGCANEEYLTCENCEELFNNNECVEDEESGFVFCSEECKISYQERGENV